MPPRFPDGTIIRIDLRGPSRAFSPLTETTHTPGSEGATARDLNQALQLLSRYSRFIKTLTLLSGQ